MDCEQSSWWEPRSPTTPRVEGSDRTVLACPTPAASAPPTTRHLSRVRSAVFIRWPTSLDPPLALADQIVVPKVVVCSIGDAISTIGDTLMC
jgi:hypothetical protein